MSSKLSSKITLMALFAVAAIHAAAQAGDLKKTAPYTASDLTGAINPRGGMAAPVASRARAALGRFSEARAAMEHGILLREMAPKSDITTVRSGMTALVDDLAAVEQMEQGRFAGSAKEARRLADAWYVAGMKIIAPPANGVTELPSTVSVKSKADALSTALDWLVEETAANASVMAPAAPAVTAAAVMIVPALKAARMARTRHASRKALLRRAPVPISQNEASLKLMRDGLPLFLPPAALFMRSDNAAIRR